jgi:DnaJ-class molecular chaperone
LTQTSVFRDSLIRFLKKPKVNWQSPDMYERLGVKSDATIEEIKKKYHELVRAYHPDMIKDPKEKEEGQKIIASVNEAYEQLKDEGKRQEYDASRFTGNKSYYQTVFQQQQKIHRARVNLTFFESMFGANKEIVLEIDEMCPKCHGQCTDDNSQPEQCQVCQGNGVFLQGFMPIPCPQCGGRGVHIKNPCKSCGGQGTIPKPKNITIQTPKGIENGSVINFQSQFGIVMALFFVEEDPLLKRDGNDLHVTVPISVKTAMLGGKVLVPTLNGAVEKRVLPGTQPYDVERMTMSNGATLYIHYKVIIPRSLSSDDKSKVKNMNEKYMNSTNDNWKSYIKAFEDRLKKGKNGNK